MRKIAFATLVRQRAPAHECTVEIVALDLPVRPGADVAAHCVVTVRQGRRAGGALIEVRESSLTPMPCTADEAHRRAQDFLQRRLAAGESLERSEGFDGLVSPPPPVASVTAPAAAAAAAASPRLAALAARFSPSRWKLESPTRQARTAWRVAECSGSPPPPALVALVPRLVELLETGDDLLDLCLAVAIGRLRDPGATEAMRVLRERGRSPATRRAAHQAWLLLLDADARESHAATLRADALPGDEADTEAAFVGPDGAQRLLDAYDLAFARADARTALLALLARMPLVPEVFQGVRYLYKAAEVRDDTEVLGLLHARFENTPANPRVSSAGVRRRGGKAGTAYGPRTRNYFRLRGWRHLRRLSSLGHPAAPALAVHLLLGLDDAELPEAREETRWQTVDGRYTSVLRHYARSAGWLLVPKLLLGGLDGVHTSARGTRWWTAERLDLSKAAADRVDGLRAMWDQHPGALLQLAMFSRSALVHAVAARALQDHSAFVQQQPEAVLSSLLLSPYAPTASVGFSAVRARVELATEPAAQVPWLRLLVTSPLPAARDFGLLHLAGDPAAFAVHVPLVVAMMLAEHGPVRRQGRGLALLSPPVPLFAELAAALLAVDPAAPALDTACGQIAQLLTTSLVEPAARAPVEPVLCLLEQAATPVVDLAVTWLLLQPHGLAVLPPATLTRLLGADDPLRRACGVRLLAALPDEVLRTQTDLMADLALQPDAVVRAAVAPALQRLAEADPVFATTLAERLHAALFRAEAGEGVHDDALQWLTQMLVAVAPGRDPASVWRALQAQSAGAQRYGAWALADLAPAAYSVRQQATLARHTHVAVRTWALQAIDATLTAAWPPTPEQSAQLLPLADAEFDDARAAASSWFGDRLPDASLTTELLIAWVDHPRDWVQALGRQRLVRRMDAAEASLCLTRLSQHPSPQVQLFVTQWLLELPAGDAAALAARLRALKPYFLAVLSQVQRGRTAKSRVIAFLRAHTEAPETAAVVAEIFARQVVTASLTDKPQFIAGLRDIAARHPQIDLPFLVWKAPALSAATT